MKRAGGWLATSGIWLLVLGLTIFRGGRTAVFMLSLLTLILLQAAVFQWMRPRQVQIRRYYSSSRLYAGDSVEVLLSIKLSGGWPPLWLSVEDHLGGLEHPEQVLFAGFRRELAFSYRIDGLSRGVYGLGAEEITVKQTDGFGWCRYEIPCETAGTLIVEPRPLAKAAGEAVSSSGFEPGVAHRNDASLSAGWPGQTLRAYEPGDPVSRISWKASARTGKLFVRSVEDGEAAPLLVLLDTNPQAYKQPAWQQSELGADQGGVQAQLSADRQAEVRDVQEAEGRGGSLPADQTGSESRDHRSVFSAKEDKQPVLTPAEQDVFERAVSASAALLMEAAAAGRPVWFRHGHMDRACLWPGLGAQSRFMRAMPAAHAILLPASGASGLAEDAAASLAAAACSAAASPAERLLLESAELYRNTDIMLLTGSLSASLQAAVTALSGRGVQVNLLSCTEREVSPSPTRGLERASVADGRPLGDTAAEVNGGLRGADDYPDLGEAGAASRKEGDNHDVSA